MSDNSLVCAAGSDTGASIYYDGSPAHMCLVLADKIRRDGPGFVLSVLSAVRHWRNLEYGDNPSADADQVPGNREQVCGYGCFWDTASIWREESIRSRSDADFIYVIHPSGTFEVFANVSSSASSPKELLLGSVDALGFTAADDIANIIRAVYKLHEHDLDMMLLPRTTDVDFASYRDKLAQRLTTPLSTRRADAPSIWMSALTDLARLGAFKGVEGALSSMSDPESDGTDPDDEIYSCLDAFRAGVPAEDIFV